MVEREGISVSISADTRDFVSGIGQALQSLGGFRIASIAAAGAAATLFVADGAKRAIAYESALEMVRQKGRLTGAELAAVGKQIDEMNDGAAAARFTQEQLAVALNAVSQGSRSTADSLLIVEAAAAATTTRGGDLVANAEILNRALEATGRSGADAGATMALLQGLSDQYGVSVEDLANDLAATESRARIFGVTMEENAAIIAALAKNPSFDAKQMFVGLGQLDSPTSETTAKLLNELGVKAHDADKRLRPLAEIVGDVNRRVATGAITNEEAGRRLIAVFGDRAGVALDTYRRSLGEVALAQEVAARSGKDFAKNIEDSSNTTQSEMDKLAARFRDAGQRIGAGFADFFNYGAQGINDLIDLVSSDTWAEFWQRLMNPPEAKSGPHLGEKIASLFAGIDIGGIFGRLGAGINQGWARFAGWMSNGFQRAASIASGWVDGAKTWLVALPGNLISGVSDLGARVWGAISAGLNWVQTQFDNWRAAHPWFDRFVGTIGNIASNVGGALSGDVLTRTTAAPAASSSSSTSISIQTLSLPNVKDVQSFRAELSALSRQNEFTANYQTLSSKRSATL